MKSVTISPKGQVAIPIDIREALGIKPGDQFEVEVSNGNIVLKPVVILTVPKSQVWFWSEEIQTKIKEGEDEYRKGRYRTYKDAADLAKDLEKK